MINGRTILGREYATTDLSPVAKKMFKRFYITIGKQVFIKQLKELLEQDENIKKIDQAAGFPQEEYDFLKNFVAKNSDVEFVYLIDE